MNSTWKLLFLLLLPFTELHAVQKYFDSSKTFPFERGGRVLVDVPRNVIYLTIDDGPTRDATPAMLEVLRKHRAKATFFVHGDKAVVRPQLLEKMYRAGHLVANHSWSHVLDFRNKAHFESSLKRTHDVISNYVIPEGILVYRSPGGVWNKWRTDIGNGDRLLRKYVGPIFWNVGGGRPGSQNDADWKCWRRGNGVTVRDCANSYYNQIMSNYNRGLSSIVLLHDLKTLSARMLDQVLTRLESNGVNWKYEIVSEIPAVREYQF